MSLNRVAVGPITLKGLPVGECRPLTRHEVDLLRKVASGIAVSVPGFADGEPSTRSRRDGQRGERPRPHSNHREPSPARRRDQDRPARRNPGTRVTRTQARHARRGARPPHTGGHPTADRARLRPKKNTLRHRTHRSAHRPGAHVAARSIPAFFNSPQTDRRPARIGHRSSRSDHPTSPSARPAGPSLRSNGPSRHQRRRHHPGAASSGWRNPHQRRAAVGRSLVGPVESVPPAASPGPLAGWRLLDRALRPSKPTRTTMNHNEFTVHGS